MSRQVFPFEEVPEDVTIGFDGASDWLIVRPWFSSDRSRSGVQYHYHLPRVTPKKPVRVVNKASHGLNHRQSRFRYSFPQAQINDILAKVHEFSAGTRIPEQTYSAGVVVNEGERVGVELSDGRIFTGYAHNEPDGSITLTETP